MRKNDKNNRNNPRIIEGFIILGISLFMALILFGALGKSGASLANFFLGIFGFSLYGYTCAGFTFATLYLCKLHIRNNKLHILMSVATLVLIILTFHTMSSVDFVAGNNFGDYIKACYTSAKTAGGVFGAIIVYPLLKLNYTVALSVFSVLFFISLFTLLWLEFYKGKSGTQKPKSVQYVKNAKRPQMVDLSASDNSNIVISGVSEKLFTDTIGNEKSRDKLTKKPSKADISYTTLQDKEGNQDLAAEGFLAGEDVVLDQPVREKKKKRSIDILYGDGQSDTVKADADKLVVEDLSPNKNPRQRAVDILYSSTVANSDKKNNEKADISKDYEGYTNSYRLQQIKNNLAKRAGAKDTFSETPLVKKDSSASIFDSINDAVKSESFDNNFDDEFDKAFDKMQDSSDSDNQIKKPQSSFILDEEVVDKTTRNPEALSNFERAKGFDSNIPSAFELGINRKMRSDKGGTHSSGNDRQLPSFINKIRDVKSNSQPIKSIDNAPDAIVPYKSPKSMRPYIAPPVDLLNEYPSVAPSNLDFSQIADRLENALEQFGINASVIAHKRGPAFTRFELQMPPGVPVRKILALADDIAMNLAVSKVRILAPIPGKNAVGVEIPNDITDIVGIKDLVRSPEFNQTKQAISFALGKDLDGKCFIGDLAKMPHLLMAGATGSGKSVGINTLLCSILYKYDPSEVKLILVDPKRVELNIYSGLPHMIIKDVIYKDEQVLNALDWAIHEMETRYTLFMNNQIQNITGYNELAEQDGRDKLPYIVIVIDELAELMMSLKKDLEDRIKRLTQLARAAGIHLIVATQRPSVDIITGVIKSNLPSRVAFQVSSGVDSRTILGTIGAEKLLGNGDMLYAPATLPDPVRLQGAYVSGKEVRAICNFIREHNESCFDEDVYKTITTEKQKEIEFTRTDMATEGDDFDPVFIEALRIAVEDGSISISKVQRKLALGYPRAGKIIDLMEKKGYIDKDTGTSKPRSTHLSLAEFLEMYGDNRVNDDEE